MVAETIAVVSPKGGVGKTTVAANVGIALGRLGMRTLLIDANFDTPNLSLYLGVISTPLTIRDLFRMKIIPTQAMYAVEKNTHLMPASITNPAPLDRKKLKRIIDKTKEYYDFIILDSPPGRRKYIQDLLEITQSSLLVLTPDLPTVATSRWAAKAAEKGENAMRIVLNKVTGSRFEIPAKEVERSYGFPVIGKIPFDRKVIKAVENLKPVVDVKCKAAFEIRKIACKIAGVKCRTSIFEKIASIFA